MRRFRTVAIVGVGLIGGSIGLALRRRGLAERVVGIGRRETSLDTARRVGAIDAATTDLAEGVAEADLVVVCSPVGRIVEHVRRSAEHCPENTLITDAGSTKQSIVAALDRGLARGCRFLGGHPIAGSEKTGPAHARADLFEGRLVILTPTENTAAEDLEGLTAFWSGLGSVVIRMAAADHDRALAVSSHLPHAVSAALAAVLPEEYASLAGTGFLDSSRLAGGDPELWKQIFLLNRENVLAAMERFLDHFHALREALRASDETALERFLTLAKKHRDALGN
jgi:prephenate dehydrogenase